MKQIQLQVNTNLNGIAAGAVIAVEVDERGVPLDTYWRRRLVDAARDGCVTVLDDVSQSAQKSPLNQTKASDHDDD
jgi:hypothetical protein